MHGFESLDHTGLAFQHFDHMKAEAAVHQTWQHADIGLSEQFLGEFRRAVARDQPAKRAAIGTTRAVRQGARRRGKTAVGVAAIVAAHIEQAGFSALAQSGDIDAGCHGKQDVAHVDFFTAAVARQIGCVVALASFL